MMELKKEARIFRFQKFSGDSSTDTNEYEKIMNNPNTSVAKEECYFDKYGNYFIALHWFEDCTKEERKNFMAKKTGDAKAPPVVTDDNLPV